MLVLIRLTPRGDLDDFCELIESEKRALYWEDVKPLYLLKQEGKDYVSVVLDIKNLDAIQKLFSSWPRPPARHFEHGHRS